MNTHPQYSDPSAPPRRNSPWFGIGLFLIVVILGLLFFFMASRVSLNRYHQGNPLNQPVTMPAQKPPPTEP